MLVNEALEALKAKFKPKNESEILPLSKALGKTLANDVMAVKDLPCFDNSALDGFAVKFDEKDKPYKIIASAFAGDKEQLSIGKNECVKIMTGAKMPKGADTVMRFEDCIVEGEFVKAPEKLKKGDAYRFKGEEAKIGEILLKSGEILNTRSVMMLAAQGISFIDVKKQPNIAVYSSGNEIIEPWQRASEDEIYNANAFGITALLSSIGQKSSYLGIIKDELSAVKQAFLNAANYDIVICSGGASAGEADFMKIAMGELGYSEIFSHLKIRPGRPCKAYEKDGKLIFVLPGNPMAAYICMMMLVLPLLKEDCFVIQKATNAQNLKVKSGRINAIFGNIENDKFIATNGGKYGSGMIDHILKSTFIFLTSPDQSEILQNSEIFLIKLP
ncbi:molybdopterin molybdotransferase MoeA [Campylobacter concisus]|jgi:molybdopterin biosynthesis enzyme|uniref:Molybdopterin molybdenumtransferase n=1 Tax=Campylobacter concisus TaxID=199 RepID=A0A7S9NF01_9BACT|nr:molybdopterin molybdotransferase MoeA [Campylobacter concisus]QPH84456.1 molybdopterin molybdotransferase MoeA [Campylobacter concisus]